MTWLDYARKNNIEPCVKDKDGRIVAHGALAIVTMN